jgi:hypothetical protein
MNNNKKEALKEAEAIASELRRAFKRNPERFFQGLYKSTFDGRLRLLVEEFEGVPCAVIENIDNGGRTIWDAQSREYAIMLALAYYNKGIETVKPH